MRSDQLPPTTDTAAFTTCSADHTSGTRRTPPAVSVSFSSRNASVELPRVNTARTIMKRVNRYDPTAPPALSSTGAEARPARLSCTGAGAPPPARADADTEPRIPMSSARCGRRRSPPAPPALASSTRKINATATAPGTIVSANSVRYRSGYTNRNNEASAGPTTAPA